MHPGNGHGAAKEAKGGAGIAKKRRHMRAILKEGLEAALRANPEVVENCTPRTFAGKLVRGMLIEAAKAKTTPLKEVMSLIDWQPPPGEATEDYVVETWDWSEDGVWETMPEEAPKTEAPEPEDDRPRQELLRIERLIEVGDFERVARIAQAMLSGEYRDPPTAPA